MDWAWMQTSLATVGVIFLAAVGVYVSLVLCTRIAGLRSFSKLSSFDFAVTVAIGSVVASTVMNEEPPLLRGITALGALYIIQIGVAGVRYRFPRVQAAVDNKPLLLMAGQHVVEENLRRAQMTKADLQGKLREANVIDLQQVRAVVMESTGDVIVLHADPEGPALDPALFDGVDGREHLFDQT